MRRSGLAKSVCGGAAATCLEGSGLNEHSCLSSELTQDPLNCVCVQVKRLGDKADIAYLSYQGKLGVCARDLCLLRAWQQRADGTTVLVSTSIDVDDVPKVTGKVRAECRDCAYFVTPVEGGCIFSYVIQLDMKGYVPLFFSNLIQTQHPLIITMLRRHLESCCQQKESH